MENCSCKVGLCPQDQCQSPYKRCGCDCDGVDPFAANARQPPHGQQYGASYMAAYKDEVQMLFGLGAADFAAKMGPAIMFEELKRKHPRIYSLPSENDLRSEISKLYTKSKSQQAAAQEDHEGNYELQQRGRKSKIPLNVHTFIKQFFENDNAIKPAAGLASIRQKN